MEKRNKKSVIRIYFVIIGLIAAIMLAGFASKGKSVTIEADGNTKTVFTHTMSADALLREVEIPLGPNDEIELSTASLENGSKVTVRRAVPVNVIVKNKTSVVYTGKRTAQEVAKALGYSEPDYCVFDNPDALVQQDMTIRIGVVSRKEITEDEVMPYPIETIPDESLAKGEEQVVQQGVNGRKTVKTNIVYADGKQIARIPVSETVITEVKPLIRHVGTKEAVVETASGNQSPYRAIMRMTATAYLPTDGDGRGITKSGLMARYGIVAVDPHVIPLGTRVFIPGYGTALAADTGGDINGARIDLCMEDYNSCMNFGRRDIDVYILQ